jgi:hypothetical protein
MNSKNFYSILFFGSTLLWNYTFFAAEAPKKPQEPQFQIRITPPEGQKRPVSKTGEPKKEQPQVKAPAKTSQPKSVRFQQPLAQAAPAPAQAERKKVAEEVLPLYSFQQLSKMYFMLPEVMHPVRVDTLIQREPHTGLEPLDRYGWYYSPNNAFEKNEVIYFKKKAQAPDRYEYLYGIILGQVPSRDEKRRYKIQARSGAYEGVSADALGKFKLIISPTEIQRAQAPQAQPVQMPVSQQQPAAQAQPEECAIQ